MSGTKIYLNTGGTSLWGRDNAWFVAYFYNDYVYNQVTMTPTSYPNIYVVETPNTQWSNVSTQWTNIVFVRMNPNYAVFNWAYVWNQTNDLVYDGLRNLYTIDGWGEIEPKKSTGTWSIAPGCSFTQFNVNIDKCDANAYQLSGKASFVNPPTKGILFVNDVVSGAIVETTFPFQSPYQFQLNDIPIPSLSQPGVVEIHFSDEYCDRTIEYTPPKLTTIDVCQQSSVTLTPITVGYEYLWNTGETLSSISFNAEKDTTYICRIKVPTHDASIDNNIILNGDFEDVSLPYYKGFSTEYEQFDLNAPFDYNRPTRGWAVVTSNTKILHSSLPEISPHSGEYMLFLDGGAESAAFWISSTQQQNPDLKLQKGKIYRFSYWARNVGEDFPAGISASISYNGKNVKIGETHILMESDWTEYVTFFTATEDADNISLALTNEHVRNNTEGNDFVIDDILFQTVSAEESNLFEVFKIRVLPLPKVSISTNVHSCTEQDITIPFVVEEGNPTHYSLYFDNPIFQNEQDKALVDNEITLVQPNGVLAGEYQVSIVFIQEESGCSSSEIVPFSIDTSLVYAKWDDILFCDNADLKFVMFQWFHNQIPILGATQQFLYSPSGFSGEYHVEAYTSMGVKYTSCNNYYEAIPKSKTAMRVYTTSASRNHLVTIELPIEIDNIDLGKLVIKNVVGQIVKQEPVLRKTTTIIMPSLPGIYILEYEKEGKIMGVEKIQIY